MTFSIFSKLSAQPANEPAVHLSMCRRFKDCGCRSFLWMFLALPLCCPLMAQGVKRNIATTADQMKKPAEAPVKYADVLYRSGNRRDPFLNPLLFKKKEKASEDEEILRGLPPPGIAGTYIAQATLQGIAIRDDGRIAVIRGSDSRAYFLKAGDKLFDGYLKEIQNDSVTMVRETKLRSGKVLTQDVTKRLRTP